MRPAASGCAGEGAQRRAPGPPPAARGGVLQQLAQPLGEAHRRTQVARPVGRVGRLCGGDPGAGHVRHEGDLRRAAGARWRDRVGEGREDRVHHRGVEGVRGVQPPRAGCRARQPRLERGHGLAGPATTQSAGPLTAASDQRPSEQRRRRPPPAAARRAWRPRGSACIRRPRAATSASASSSEKTPARQAATYSPMLWPSIARGARPRPSRAAPARTRRRTGPAG